MDFLTRIRDFSMLVRQLEDSWLNFNNNDISTLCTLASVYEQYIGLRASTVSS